MPYIGQRPSKGDENNFKILDDISSYTLTFDGSDSSVVSAANDTITSLTHRFVQGQRVTYNNGGGSNIGGLTSGTVYFIIKDDHNTIKLATSASNASNGVAVNITGVGGGASHTINVAFDGINTKFKATHTNGVKARITRSAQLVISINGVIQQPHDTATPSTGFGFDLDGTIVFSQAPVATDEYWAHVLTNNNVTFDISDNDIDNFTGNGSTVSFNLSKSPPDNRNVLVTIDGVIQYPNDPDGTVRSYSVVENVLTFVTAPASGVEIQVRHIGFAGSTSGSGSGGVTSFYGRTGAVVLKNTDNVVVNNATIEGDLTVNGTTTTLDTNLIDVDRIEVATTGTNVAVAVTHNGTGDLVRLYDGTVQKVTVDSEGKVGIGTNNPFYTTSLDVLDSSSGTDEDLFSVRSKTGAFLVQCSDKNAANPEWRLRTFSSEDLVFSPGGQGAAGEKVRITSAGLVGIGSAVPTHNLDVVSSSNAYIKILKSGSNPVYFGNANGEGVIETTGDTFIKTGGDERLRIAADSNITQTIDTDGDGFIITAGDMKPMLTGNSNRSAENNTIFGISGKWNNTEVGRIAFEAGPDTTNKDDGNINLYTRVSGGSLTSRLRITSDGQLIHKANKASGYIAEFHQDHASNSGQILIDSPTNNDGRPVFIDLSRAGTLQWSIGQGYNHSGGAFHFATSSLGAGITGSKLIITSAGKVGVGTVSPLGTVDIVNSGADASDLNNLGVQINAAWIRIGDVDAAGKTFSNGLGVKFYDQGTAHWSYGVLGSDFLIANTSNDGNKLFPSNRTAPVIIKSDGKVGIGTENPDTLLEIYNPGTSGNTTLKIHNDKTGDAAQLMLEGGRTSLTDCAQVIFANRGNLVSGIIANSAADDGNLTFRTSASGSNSAITTYGHIATDGKVKFGKNAGGNPGARFHVEDDSTTAYNASSTTSASSVYLVNTGTNGPMGIILQNASGDGSNTCQATIHSVAESNNKNTALTFGTRQDSDGTIRERLRITSDGKVGVNESSPDHMFHIKGTSGNNDPVLAVESSSWATGRSAALRLAYTDGNAREIRGHYEDGLQFILNNGEAMRITTGGDVLINDTTNSLYNDSSGGGMNLKAAGQLVLAKQANSTADSLIWLNDTGQTTNRFIVMAQDGSEKGYIGLTGGGLSLGGYGSDKILIEAPYGASYPTSRGSVKLGGGNATNGFPLIGYNNNGTKFATHLCTGSFYQSTGMIIIKTTLPKHNTGYTMWSCRISGYAYSSNQGGAIDCVVGCYTGEGNYYNPTVTGSYPDSWRNNISFATITTGDHNNHLCIRLGTTSTTQICEIAVTDFVWGYSSVSDVMAEGWSIVCLTSESGYNTNIVSAIHRSREFYNDEFAVGGAGSGELLTNRRNRGGTIQGTYQYTQISQGTNYYHYIKSPKGDNDITDSYAGTNWSAIVTVGMTGTGTQDSSTTWFFQDSATSGNYLVGNHLYGNTSYTSNRVVMGIDAGRPFWRTAHSSNYTVSVKVQFLHGGLDGATYTDEYGSYGGN